ncbi:hypothetical protein [Streptomyces collinus]
MRATAAAGAPGLGFLGEHIGLRAAMPVVLAFAALAAVLARR